MKRDPRLQGLSSEHHHALVLARALCATPPSWSEADGAALEARFAAELEPHFRVEEDVLLPALQALRDGAAATLTERTAADHRAIRSSVAEARRGDGEAARRAGALLASHVRFEERELFPFCEERLAGQVLDEVARRAPKER